MSTTTNNADSLSGNQSTLFTTGSVLSADGTTIGYRKYGQGPALIMLHGANTSGQDFTQLAKPLSDLFTVYLPDRRGRGLSGPITASRKRSRI